MPDVSCAYQRSVDRRGTVVLQERLVLYVPPLNSPGLPPGFALPRCVRPRSLAPASPRALEPQRVSRRPRLVIARVDSQPLRPGSRLHHTSPFPQLPSSHAQGTAPRSGPAPRTPGHSYAPSTHLGTGLPESPSALCPLAGAVAQAPSPSPQLTPACSGLASLATDA